MIFWSIPSSLIKYFYCPPDMKEWKTSWCFYSWTELINKAKALEALNDCLVSIVVNYVIGTISSRKLNMIALENEK